MSPVADPTGLAQRMAGLLDLDPERVRLWLFARCAQESPHDIPCANWHGASRPDHPLIRDGIASPGALNDHCRRALSV